MATSPSGADEAVASAVFGSRVERREDPKLITGRARYVDDLREPGMVHVAFVRSPYAHARIESIDASDVEADDDVLAVYTWADLEAAGVPGVIPCIYRVPDVVEPPHRVLASERVRYQGKPVAAVVAADAPTARAAAERVDVAYERLDAVTDPLEAVSGNAPILHEEAPDNVCFRWETGDERATDEAFASADHVVETTLTNQRIVPNSMDPRGVLATYDPDSDVVTVHAPSQQPFLYQGIMADVLGHPKRKIRIVVPDVGGGFGMKSMYYPDETVVAFAAMQLGRPVKWVETRTEAFLADEHGRDQRIEAGIAVDDDGTVRGLRVRTTAGIGGELGSKGMLGPSTTFGTLLSGQYAIPAIHFRGRGVFTTNTPTGVYRGVGRVEAGFTVERLMDLAAREIGMDPAAFRRRNFVAPDAFPYQTPVGVTYDSGEYERALELALETVGYDGLRERQAALRDEGRYLGVGVSCFVESGGFAPSSVSSLLGMGLPDATVKQSFWESATVRVHDTGEVTVYCGTASQGQGSETSHAQVVADALGVPMADVEAIEGKDTRESPPGTGSIGSRGAATGGGAITGSVEKVVAKARRIAAHHLETAEDDLDFAAGAFRVRGTDRTMTLQAVAEEAYLATDLPGGMEPGLEATTVYDPKNFTFAFGAHVAVVEVDPETGEVDLQRYVAVDDCGEQINPTLVEGQIHGGIAQGVGQALYEGAVYDENGTLLTGSFQDYAMPRAHHLPDLELEETVTPSPHNPLGVKGVAESGTIGAPPAVVNAVVDALEPFGVDDVETPMTPERVWRAATGRAERGSE